MLLIMLTSRALKDKVQDLFCSFTCTLAEAVESHASDPPLHLRIAEAAGLISNLSLDSQTKTTGNPAPATKVTYFDY